MIVFNVRPSNDILLIFAKFFFGIPFEPPRAKINAIVVFVGVGQLFW